MYQPTDNYFPVLHGLLLGPGETRFAGEPEGARPIDAKEALAGLLALEQAYPSEPPPEEVAGQVRYLVEHYLSVLDHARKALQGTGKKSAPSPEVRAALKELHYKNNWKFAGYITPVKAELPEVLQLLKKVAESVERKKTGLIGEENLSGVRNMAQRCLKLAQVGPGMDFQMAKQINTANSKMMGVLRETLECNNLGMEDRQFLGEALAEIGARIKYAAENHGADFKSCDSAGIDLENQLERAEDKCTQAGASSTRASQGDY